MLLLQRDGLRRCLGTVGRQASDLVGKRSFADIRCGGRSRPGLIVEYAKLLELVPRSGRPGMVEAKLAQPGQL